jgi:type IV pilus assembly protein PilX
MDQTKGFALIASMLFLVVLTLLGISAFSGVGLQERMASNLKEKERATEVAEVATRGAESFLSNYPPPGVFEEIPPAKADGTGGVWTLNGPLPNDDIADLLSDANWASGIEFAGPPFDTSTLIGSGITGDSSDATSKKYAAKPRSFTEEAAFVPYTLDPDDAANGKGLFYYRVSGRGVGGNATAVSIVQSMYMQRYK